MTEETRNKISAALKGKSKSDAHRKAMAAAHAARRSRKLAATTTTSAPESVITQST